MPPMRVVLLGTGSPLPDPDRAGPATLVQAGDTTVLVDCGRGVVMRLAGAGVPPASISLVLLTHLHSDHIADLNDVITTRWVTGDPVPPLEVVGPPGTRAVVDGTLTMLQLDIGYRRAHHSDLRAGDGVVVNVTEVNPGDKFPHGDVVVSVHETDHRPVAPTVGYRITHDRHVVAIAGDTVPCPGLDALCDNADILVQTVLREDLVRDLAAFVGDKATRFLDILDYHSTLAQAAQTASRAGVKTLALTHFIPAPQLDTEMEWAAPATRHYSGRIVAGPDLTEILTE